MRAVEGYFKIVLVWTSLTMMRRCFEEEKYVFSYDNLLLFRCCFINNFSFFDLSVLVSGLSRSAGKIDEDLLE